MKKLLIIMMVTVAIAISATVFATTQIGTTGNPTQTIGGASFTPSQNVIISTVSITTAYVATSAHASAASGPGYEFQIDSTYNGIQKKQWVDGVSPGTWPTPVTSATTSVPGFQ